MTITRGKKSEGFFYVLDKRISEDKKLSWQARGLLIYLLGKPDHWKVSVEALKPQTIDSRKPTSRDGIYSILDELSSAGYVKKTVARDLAGRLLAFEYVVNEVPFTAEPLTAEPLTANTTLVSNDLKQGLKESANLCDQQAEHVPYDKIFEAYGRILPKLPKLRIFDDSRKAMIRAIWKKDKRFQTVEFWEKYFDAVRRSTWLMTGFRGCCFDWLLKPANFRKVVEGNYDNA